MQLCSAAVGVLVDQFGAIPAAFRLEVYNRQYQQRQRERGERWGMAVGVVWDAVKTMPLPLYFFVFLKDLLCNQLSHP
jgi:hypothetical protein